MKTEELKEKGLTDEQINFVMAENGKDVEKYKTLSETQKTQLDDVNKKLTSSNKQIDSFKEMDIETIKKSAEEYKTKYEQAQKESEAKIKEMQYDSNLAEYIKSLNITDDVYSDDLKKQIKEKDLKFEDGKLLGGDDFVKSYKEKHPNAFKDSVKPNFSSSVEPTVPNETVQVNMLRKAMGLPEKKV